jgi:hypothetical protein
LKDIYEILREGNIEELKKECRRRNISDAGDALALRRRILDHEFEMSSVSFEKRVQDLPPKGIILNRSDFIQFEENEKGDELVLLSGDVDVVFTGKKIRADEVRINITTGFISGNGDVTFLDSGREYFAESFFYNVKTDEGHFFNASTRLKEYIYRGKVIGKVHESDKFVGQEVSLTTCSLEDPHYKLEAEKLFLYDDERLFIKGPSLDYGESSVLRFPYFYKWLKNPIRTSASFGKRSGFILQNTYYPIAKDERELVFKGDFYERLGFSTGADFFSSYPFGETDLSVSGALSNDVFFYDSVTENWSPLGPPDTTDEFNINRTFRYKAGIDQEFHFGNNYENDVYVDLLWYSDPYYKGDFERRSEWFNPLDLMTQAKFDDPRKASGLSWELNDDFSSGPFSFSVHNNVRFEPQRNTDVDIVPLPDYYEYRLFTLTAPSTTFSYSDTVLDEDRSLVLYGMNYSGNLNYYHTVYYDENEVPSSEVHRGTTYVNLNNNYPFFRYLTFKPAVEVGAQAQGHVDPDVTERDDDRENTFLYGRTTENFTLGSTNLYFNFAHDLKYQFLGEEEFFQYGRYRVHELRFKGFAGWDFITEQFTTSFDLRPDFQQDRFTPLINSLIITPIPSLSLSDVLVYDIGASEFKTNSFILNYSSKSLYLIGREITVSWELEWEHNFINPVLDNLFSTYGISYRVHPFWTLYFSTYSQNRDMWRYFPDTARERGEDPVNPFTDLLKSFNFFNSEDREESFFKLRSISAGFVHDLHDWELRFDYTGQRELLFDETKYIWSNTFSVSLGLKKVKNVLVKTEYEDRR